MITFPLYLLTTVIVGFVALAIGYRFGFNDGHEIGWDAGEDYSNWHQTLPWEKTVSSDTATATAPAAASEPVELTIHPSHLNFPQS